MTESTSPVIMASETNAMRRSVASAVVLPNATPSSPRRSPVASQSPQEARAGTKRRQSPASHDSPKRQRLSPSPDRIKKEDHGPPNRERRPVKPMDEKKRNQRLFGGLLRGLSQTRPANAQAAKRRAEQEERRRQKEQELSERQTERVELLNVARKKEQQRVDEASMRIKHENMKAIANFLTTSTEPKLYFKPWELLPEQEDQINRQHEDVDVQIDQDLDDFDQVRQRWQTEDANGHSDQQEAAPTHVAPNTSNGTDHVSASAIVQEVPVAEPVSEPSAVTVANTTEVKQDQQQEQVQDQAAEDVDRHRKDSIDDTGDIVVEADEDTVIY
ncbi:hypothetical protein E4T39_01284 [Aureobasidium subglaciale]|nr:hypothetical protein E4T39_01284 [Aureobasidium subglaciale]